MKSTELVFVVVFLGHFRFWFSSSSSSSSSGSGSGSGGGGGGGGGGGSSSSSSSESCMHRFSSFRFHSPAERSRAVLGDFKYSWK